MFCHAAVYIRPQSMVVIWSGSLATWLRVRVRARARKCFFCSGLTRCGCDEPLCFASYECLIRWRNHFKPLGTRLPQSPAPVPAQANRTLTTDANSSWSAPDSVQEVHSTSKTVSTFTDDSMVLHPAINHTFQPHFQATSYSRRLGTRLYMPCAWAPAQHRKWNFVIYLHSTAVWKLHIRSLAMDRQQSSGSTTAILPEKNGGPVSAWDSSESRLDSTVIPIREEFRVRRLWFFYHDLRAFTTSVS